VKNCLSPALVSICMGRATAGRVSRVRARGGMAGLWDQVIFSAGDAGLPRGLTTPPGCLLVRNCWCATPPAAQRHLRRFLPMHALPACSSLQLPSPPGVER